MGIKRILRANSIPTLLQWLLKRGAGLASASRRMLPDFIILGAQRSGTTSLYNYISQHPEVSPSFPKETHYFSNHHHKGMSWYRSHFPLNSRKPGNENQGNGQLITGEATPYYLIHPLAPQRAFQAVPKTKLIVLLRDPVKRAYSHYFHEVNMGVETLGFEEAIDKEQERLEQEFDRLATDERYQSFNFQHFSYLTRGIYIDQILRWLQYFSIDSFLFMNSQRLKEDPPGSYKEVLRFLGLSSWDGVDFMKHHASTYPPMNPETRNRLDDFYQIHNQRLFDLLPIHFN
jgi:hypothetical protein